MVGVWGLLGRIFILAFSYFREIFRFVDCVTLLVKEYGCNEVNRIRPTHCALVSIKILYKYDVQGMT